jgi:hypothetical protein
MLLQKRDDDHHKPLIIHSSMHEKVVNLFWSVSSPIVLWLGRLSAFFTCMRGPYLLHLNAAVRMRAFLRTKFTERANPETGRWTDANQKCLKKRLMMDRKSLSSQPGGRPEQQQAVTSDITSERELAAGGIGRKAFPYWEHKRSPNPGTPARCTYVLIWLGLPSCMHSNSPGPAKHTKTIQLL